VGNTKPGTKSTITVLRRGKLKELSMVIAEVPSDESAKAKAGSGGAGKTPPSGTLENKALGLTLSELTAAQKKELAIKGGVRVSAAVDAAARAGLREGDVILQLANVEVSDLKSFEAAWAKADKSKPVNVLVRRGDWAQYVLIRPAK
jgi:serine protease Do